jgi:hypothetical protein
MSTARHLEDYFSEAEETPGHIASFNWASTGVDNTIFLSPKGYARHAARIKVAIDPPETLDVTAVTASVADEGVPLRAIARVTRISSENLRERLQAAKDVGSLVELPRDDWPPGFPRDQRALQLSPQPGAGRSWRLSCSVCSV